MWMIQDKRMILGDFLNLFIFILDLIPSCEVEVMVWRGTTWETAPQQNLSVSCPVKHCGESIKVTWCKLLHTNTCEQMNYTENVETNTTQDELISYLNFTRISIHDDGLYRCNVKGDRYEQISNIINISVSGRQFLLPQCQIINIKCLISGINCIYFLWIYRFIPGGKTLTQHTLWQ